MKNLHNSLLVLSLSALLSTPSLAAADPLDYFAVAGRSYPKTLLEWSGVPHEEEPEDPNPRIITDRPHFAEAATTVGLGRVQVETGYTYYRDDQGGTRVQTHSFPETLLRVGMFREWFEFRLGYNYFVEKETLTGQSLTMGGSDDIYLGAKVALTKQSGILPELTVFPQMRVPSGHPNFTSGQVLPGMNFVYAWMVTEKLELEANTNVNRRGDFGLDHYYTEVFQTFNFEYDLCERLMLFNEFVLIWPNGALAAATQYYEHAGVHIFLMPNVQIDIHAGVGLNQAADDFFGGTGFCWRW
ncbi:MAG: transporter [Planctomycetia bacterium]|nr:transporter [Planctomycetia bacterium]